jgi:hypothetical protein
MPRQAKSGCAEHHRAVIERISNLLPPAWLLQPQSREVFDNRKYYNRRPRSYTLAEGFDLVPEKEKVYGLILVRSFARLGIIESSKIAYKGMRKVL